jgi:general secretion pathway protein H
MPTSETGISSNATAAASTVSVVERRAATGGRWSAAGFSLLELLVVLVIIGIFFGVVMLSAGLLQSDRDVEQQARRLKSVIDLVREEALMQSRDYGVLFGNDGYRFYVYDYDERAWLEPADDDLLAPHGLGDGLEIELRLEDRDLDLELETEDAEARDDVETPEPQVLILSSGELTPFEVVVRRETDRASYRLVAELNGSTEIENDDTRVD